MRDAHVDEGAERSFAEAGIGCAAMSYRLFPTVDWPVPVEDVAAAYAWLRRNIGDRGGVETDVFIVGHSSGCTLATIVAGDPQYLATHDLATTDIAGVVAMGCRLNDQFEYVDAVVRSTVEAEGVSVEDATTKFFSENRTGARFGRRVAMEGFRPMTHVGRHLPPTLVLIAEAERYKPPILADAAIYVGAARDADVDADIAILPDRTHYSSIRLLASPDDPTRRLITAFVRRLSARP